jgi:hypothetical protein
MRVRLIRKLADVLDGVDVSAHAVGDVLRLAPVEGELLIAEGWAERVMPSSSMTLRRYRTSTRVRATAGHRSQR